MTRAATLVLLSWQRVDNFPQILTSLGRYPFIRQVLVWNNAEEGSAFDIALRHTLRNHQLSWPRHVELLGVGENICCWGRYKALEHAAHDLILTQDDDVIVNNWPQILEGWERRKDVVTAALAPEHRQQSASRLLWKDGEKVLANEVLVGWGAAFPRALVIPAFQKYLEVYGVDDVLQREADRIFTIGCQRQHQLLHRQVTGLVGRGALHLQRVHETYTIRARTQALKLLGVEYDHKGK